MAPGRARLQPDGAEIGDELGIRSPNGVVCHIRALIDKGMLERGPRNICRGLVPIDRPGTIPVLGRVAAGSLHAAYESDEELPLAAIIGRADSVATVEDDSLEPEGIRRGDFILHRGSQRVAVVRIIRGRG